MLEEHPKIEGCFADTMSFSETMQAPVARIVVSSDVPGPAQSREPGQAKPVWAGPSQAIGDSPAMALAWLRAAESQSRRLRPWLWTM
jgi:hypothetical protein